MRIAIAQINPHPGNIDANCRKITREIDRAVKNGASLVIFPELSLTGYPPLDLLESKLFIRRTEDAVKTISAHCTNIAVIIGAPTRNTGGSGKKLFNSALFIENGTVMATFNKALLPAYDIFDEPRYFEPETSFTTLKWKDINLAVTICEDMWDEQSFEYTEGKKCCLYHISPMRELANHNPGLVINIAAVPFAHNRLKVREILFKHSARRYKVPVIMVNQVGANANIIFDGGSLIINNKGELWKRLPLFREELFCFNLNDLGHMNQTVVEELPGKYELIRKALTTGISDYLRKTGLHKVTLGLSGGIDSALCAVLAVEAVGPENVVGLIMPSRYSSQNSITDAQALAANLNIKYEIIGIDKPFATFTESMSDVFRGTTSGVTEENIQARIRGVILMAYSNKFGHLVLNSSNKSEAATGYGTLYGDMAGALSVLGDLYKTEVFELAHHINQAKEIIPQNIITKEPSAELRENQLDSDTLPPYEILDKILFKYIEQVKDAAEIVSEGYDHETVKRVTGMVDSSEYKRYQSAPVLRISVKAFGQGRRIPLVSGFRQ